MPVANPSYLAYPQQRLSEWTLNVFPKRVIATAQLNAPTTTLRSYPQGNLDIDTTVTWSNVKVGMLVEISRAGAVYYRGAARRLGSASKVYLGGFSRAESGIVGLADAVQWADNDVVTIYDVRIPFSFWSRIDTETNKVLKQWTDTVYYSGTTISKTEYPLPVANLGAWQRGIVSGGVATLTHSAANSTVWRGSSFTVLWILPTGATLVGGYALTDATIQVTYTPGVYIIGCTVTEVGGSSPERARTAWRYVWAIDNSTAFDTSQQIAFTVSSDETDDTSGRSLSVTAQADSSLVNTLYVGAPVLMTYAYRYSSNGWVSEVSVPEANGTFSGYISEITEVSDDGLVKTLSIRVDNPLAVLNRLGIASQVLRVRASGNQWFKTIDAAGALGNIAYLAYYLLDHHAPYTTDLHDFYYSALTAFQKYAYSIDAQGLNDALQQACALCLDAKASTTSDGAIRLRRSPAYETTVYNDALDQYLTLTGTLVDTAVTYARQDWNRIYDARGGYFVTSVSATPDVFIARAKLGAPSVGSGGIAQMQSFIALSKADGKDRVGHYYQAQNAPLQSIDVSLSGMQDVFDPAQPRLYLLNFNTYDAYNWGLLNSTRFICTQVSRSWEVDELDTVVRIRAMFTPVTRGSRAKIEPQPAIVVPDVFIINSSQAQTLVLPLPTSFAVATLPDNTPSGGLYVAPYGWGVVFDFTIDERGFTGITGIAGQPASYQAGQGWNQVIIVQAAFGTTRQVAIERGFGAGASNAFTVGRVDLVYTNGYKATGGNNLYAVALIGATAAFDGTFSSYDGSGTAPIYSGAVLPQVNGLRAQVNPSSNTDGTIGTMRFQQMKVYGTGTPPTWTLCSVITPPTLGFWIGTDVTTDSGDKRKVVDLYQDFTPNRNIRRLYITYALNIGTVIDDSAYCLRIYNTDDDGTDTPLISLSFAQMATREGSGLTYTFNGSMKMQGVRVSLSSSLVASAGTPDGLCILNGIDFDEVNAI